MAIEDYYGREVDAETRIEAPAYWRAGALSGLVATLVMSVVIVPVESTLFSETIAGMYGFEGVFVVGLVAHLIHGTLFGLLFAGILSDPGVVGLTNWLWKSSVAGLVFGLCLAVVATGFILPVWLEFAGLAAVPSIPYVTTSLLTLHLVYGIVLGLLFPFLESYLSEFESRG